MSLFVASSAGAEDAKPAEWLFVHTAQTAEMTSPTTLVMPVERDIFAFTDRPNRRHAYLTAEQFAGLWADDKGDSFKADPPNAVLTWVLGDTVREAEVVITGAAAASGGKTLVYRVKFVVGTDLGHRTFLKTHRYLWTQASGMPQTVCVTINQPGRFAVAVLNHKSTGSAYGEPLETTSVLERKAPVCPSQNQF